MKKSLLIIYILFFVQMFSFGQSNYTLLGEVDKNNKVSLLWYVDNYDQNLQGVVFKKKVNNESDWSVLNTDPLLQFNASSKSLDNISNNRAVIREVETVRNQMINSNDPNNALNEVDQASLINYLTESPSNVNLLLTMFMYDYAVAMIYGFGYEDYEIKKNQEVEYGLFTVVNGQESPQAVATFKANTSDELDLTVPPKSEKIKRQGRKMSLTLAYEGEALDEKLTFVGFDIWRKVNGKNRTKLTPKTIWLNKEDKIRTLYYTDEGINQDNDYTYEIVPVSIFKNTGKPTELEWSKNKDLSLIKPIITNDQNNATDFVEEGVELKWELPEVINDQLRGFVIQRKIDDQDFETISDTLSNTEREYKDNNIKAIDYKVTYRLVVKPIDSYELWSNDLKLYYSPSLILSEEEKNLTLEPAIENNEVVVKMKWNPSKELEGKAKGYVIYCDRSGGILARERSIGFVERSDYIYKVEGVAGKTYTFAVKYADENELVYDYTDTVKVILPTPELPKVNIWPFSVNGTSINLEWEYPQDIEDIREFTLYVNGEEYSKIPKEDRNITLENLEQGTYKFTIKASTIYNVESDLSKVRTLKVL
ncbi:fibronectin type III domain-containing protein [Flammeovirga sp. SJP92]|uniref:fibronectin type III domain-containing protein n=1 Tax=Flammeovirga sp. SJP92 TaxID=1775430 RepID=UPI0012F9D0C5|nr:fibronectin type III domain-containing protein [Flammeovirga sp. SJP92]